MENAQSLIAIILGVISILGVIGGLAYWKGTVDSVIKANKGVPEKVAGLEMKMDVIWSLFVDQTLEKQPHLARRGSGYKLTPEGEECIKGMEEVISLVKKEHPDISPSDALIFVSQKMGMLEMQKIAHEAGCTLSEFYSLLTIKLGVTV
jgi:hypothetical protein